MLLPHGDLAMKTSSESTNTHSSAVKPTSQAVCGQALCGALLQMGLTCNKPLQPLSRGLLDMAPLKQSTIARELILLVLSGLPYLPAASSSSSRSQAYLEMTQFKVTFQAAFHSRLSLRQQCKKKSNSGSVWIRPAGHSWAGGGLQQASCAA